MGFNRTFSTSVEDAAINSVVYAENLSVIPHSGGAWRPENVSYIFTESVDFGSDPIILPDNAQVQFSCLNRNANTITTSVPDGTAFIRGTNVDRLEISEFEVISTAGGTFLELEGSGTGTLEMRRGTVAGFTDLGGCDDFLTIIIQNSTASNNDDGYTFNDCSFVALQALSFASQSGDHIAMSGSMVVSGIENIIAFPSSGDSVFNISSNLSIVDRISIRTSSIVGAGDVFDPAGLDETSIYISTSSADNAPDTRLVDGIANLSGSTTLDEETRYSVAVCDTSSAGFTVGLQTAAGRAGEKTLFKKLGGTNTLTLDGNGSQTVDGYLTCELTSPYAFVELESDGSNWLVVASSEEPSYGGFYMRANSTATVISATNTYTILGGTIVSAPLLRDFTFSGGVLTYTGVKDIVVNVSGSFSAERASGSAQRMFRYALFLNESEVEEITSSADISGNIKGASFTGDVALSNGDSLEVRIRNEVTTDNPVITDLTFSVRSV